MRRTASSRAAVPAAFVLALMLAGCGQPAGPPTPGTTTATDPVATVTTPAASVTTPVTPGPTPTSDGTPTATGATTPSEAWTAYTTADGQLTFDLPAAWSVREPAGELPEGGGTFAEITNKAGKPLATLRTNMATGSTCMTRHPYSVLDSQELPALTQNGLTPRFVFESRGNAADPGPANTPGAAYGIATGPAPTGDTACPIFHFFTWPPTAAMFGAFYNPANNVTPGDPSSPYLEKAERYAGTDEYRDIKRMITSLRPAG